jgi:hypothetical protein
MPRTGSVVMVVRICILLIVIPGMSGHGPSHGEGNDEQGS